MTGKPTGAKERLDATLLQRGFFPSREQARRAILAGEVRVAGEIADKPGTRIRADAPIEVDAGMPYVGRGGYKLAGALDGFGLDPGGLICLDVGASTGGFTDCLLQRGARKVHAIDVGHGQLAWKIRQDPRVAVREKLNARFLRAEDLGEPIDLAVIDVSFISLRLILPPVASVLRTGGRIVALVKPQFEVPRQQVGKGGIVRDPVARQGALDAVRTFVQTHTALAWEKEMDSPLAGSDGNLEYLICLQK